MNPINPKNDRPPSDVQTPVAQPPSAVQSSDVIPKAKPSSLNYRRNLPHIQNPDKPIFITFCTIDRWELPETIRNIVLKHILHDHGRKCWVHSVIVMPDHVHMIISLYRDANGGLFGLPEILNGIKGSSSHSINKMLFRKGSVWQDESFDHVLRSSESLSAKADYIWNNPVRKGFVKSAEQWPWFWGDWMEIPKEIEDTAEGGCATE